MRLLAASLLTCLLLLCAPAAATFENCSCSATDGTCSAGTSCPGGCIAMCPGAGTCVVRCSGGGPGGGGDGDTGYEGGSYSLTMPVSIHQVGTDNNQLASELTRITGEPVVYTPFRAGELVNLDVKKAVLWDVLDVLSMSGKVEIGGNEFTKLQNVRKALVTGEKMTVCIHGASVARVVSEFASLSGRQLQVTSGDPKTVVNLTLKDVTFDELMAKIESQNSVEVAVR